jgi:hypothetical protein
MLKVRSEKHCLRAVIDKLLKPYEPVRSVIMCVGLSPRKQSEVRVGAGRMARVRYAGAGASNSKAAMPQSSHWTYIGLTKENASGKLANLRS